MRQTRRTWLSGTGTALLVGLAGCAGILGNDGGESTPEKEGTDQPSNGETATEQPAEESGMSDPDPTDAAVVAEWNAMRTRLRDPVILGHAEEFAAGASVAAHVFEDVDDGMGKAFGTDVHDFAEAYARDEVIELERDDPGWDDKQHVMSFLDGLSGNLLVEEDAYLPLDVDGARVMISGIIDLVHFRPDRVEVVDYKTDRGRHAEAEYRKQLSVYYHVLRELYTDREISASIFYTADGVREDIDPISRDELVDVVKTVSEVE